jgi:hypothetical protein
LLILFLYLTHEKIYPLIIALLITAGIANAQEGWVTHVADNRVSVKFPVEPKELTPGSFISTDKAGVAYVFTLVDFVQVAGRLSSPGAHESHARICRSNKNRAVAELARR